MNRQRRLLTATTFIVFVLSLVFAPVRSAHAQTNDPLLSKQDYLETINVFDAWGNRPETSLNPPTTAVIGPGNVTPKHEDLRVTIPEGAQNTAFESQPSTSAFAGGIVHALTNNSIGIAGINSSENFNVLGGQFYSYEAGKLQDFEDVPDAVYAFDIGQAASHTRDALDRGADLLLTPVTVIENQPEGKVSTDLLASPMTVVPGVDVKIPTILGDLVKALGGWLYQKHKRSIKISEFKAAHTLAAKGGDFSVAPIGDFDDTKTVWPAYLSDFDIVFSVGGTTKDGKSRWPKSALSQSGDPGTGTLDIVAPAENVFSTLNSEQRGGGPKYGRRNSTAGSAAMVAGVAHRLKDINSNLEGDDLRQILRRTADDIPPEGYDEKTGYGRLNAKAAVEYLGERSITHGTVTDGDVTILEKDISFTMVASPWANLASSRYFADEWYKVEWTIDLPEGSDHDIWVRRPGTDGWSGANPTTGMPAAHIEVRSWASEATITTWGYQGEICDLNGRCFDGGNPARAENAKVAYTVATKPGTPPLPMFRFRGLVVCHASMFG